MKIVSKPERSISKQAVRRSFDKAAARYDAHGGLQQKIACDLIRTCASICAKDAHCPRVILDAGVGTGYGVRLLRDRFAHALLVGLDFAPRMIRRAAQSCDAAARFVCADAERPPFKDGAFDLIYSSSLVQWFADPGFLFAQFARVARRDARLVFSTYGPKTLYELRASFSEADGYRHTLEFPDAVELKKKLGQSGFDVDVYTRRLEIIHYRGVGELAAQPEEQWCDQPPRRAPPRPDHACNHARDGGALSTALRRTRPGAGQLRNPDVCSQARVTGACFLPLPEGEGLIGGLRHHLPRRSRV